MSALKLVEADLDLIEDFIKANIATALTEVSTDRADNAVPLFKPQTYLRYEGARGYKCPVVFTRPLSFDMINSKGANHVSGQTSIALSVLVESSKLNDLILLSLRYQCAIQKLLHLAELTTPDNAVKIVVKVDRVDFADSFKVEGTSLEVYRKEMAMTLLVDHWENF